MNTTRRTTGRGLLILVAGLAVATAISCDDSADGSGAGGAASGAAPPGDGSVTRAQVVQHLGEAVVRPTFAAFVPPARVLSSALSTWSGAPEDTEARDGAREAWRTAMAVWQEAELMQIGPAGADGLTAGGADLRDRIYSWPTTNPCRIDQELVSEAYAAAGYIADAQVNVRGLDAIEYLLWTDGVDTACPAQVQIVAQGEWANLAADPAALAGRRAGMAAALGEDLVAQATALEAAWGDDGWLAAVRDPESSAYGDARTALDAYYAALFYLETAVRDLKLAIPSGASPDCGAEACPEDVESRLSGHSVANIRANLRGVRGIWSGQRAGGAEGPGFAALAGAVGATDLVDTMNAALDDADAAFAGLEGPLDTLIRDEPARVAAAYDALKAFTVPMKTQLATVLALRVPDEGAGDND